MNHELLGTKILLYSEIAYGLSNKSLALTLTLPHSKLAKQKKEKMFIPLFPIFNEPTNSVQQDLPQLN